VSETVQYAVDEKVAIISLNRPDKHNAQDYELLQALDSAWTRAAEDNNVNVIVVRANGRNFSSGHDISADACTDQVSSFAYGSEGITNQYLWEQRTYFDAARRWRNNPKPSIAAVQGACVAAGLMLCWPCDLIVAADNAWFSDPTILMGIAGVEYHGHTWEFGARKAKQLLFTAGRITAQQAERYGMVNEVVPLDELDSYTLNLAKSISKQDRFSLMMAKRVVNQTLDTMGQAAALQMGFDLHEFQHAQCLVASRAESSVLTQDVARLRQRDTRS
jgi:enoyl-CoA hydratase